MTASNSLVPWIAAGALGCLVIYIAYRIGKVILRVFIGLTVLALLSWGLWSILHP